MMTWREEKDLISGALEALLPTLDRPHLTVPLGFRIAQITGMPERRCHTVLGWIARSGHPNATHDGGEVKSYGRTVQRWRWHPTPQHHTEGMGRTSLETRLNDLGVLDTRDW